MSADREQLRRYLQIINEATTIIAEKWGVTDTVNPRELHLIEAAKKRCESSQ